MAPRTTSNMVPSSRPIDEEDVDAGDRKQREAEGDEKDVEHDVTLRR